MCSGSFQCQRPDPLNRAPEHAVTANNRQAGAVSAACAEVSTVGDCRGDMQCIGLPVQRLDQRPSATAPVDPWETVARIRTLSPTLQVIGPDTSTVTPPLASRAARSKAAAGLQVLAQSTVSLTALVRASADNGITAIVAAQATAPMATRRRPFVFNFLAICCRAVPLFIEILLGELIFIFR